MRIYLEVIIFMSELEILEQTTQRSPPQIPDCGQMAFFFELCNEVSPSPEDPVPWTASRLRNSSFVLGFPCEATTNSQSFVQARPREACKPPSSPLKVPFPVF